MKKVFFALMVLLVGCNNSNDERLIPQEPVVENAETISGEILFKSNCSNCHKPEKDFTGPALYGALERWGNNKKAMYAFIRNSQNSINTSAYVKQLVKKWNGALMTSFPNLSDKELDAIMSYCDNYNVKPVQ